MAISIGFNTSELSQRQSDFLIRWYPTQKFISEGKSIYDWQNAVEVKAIAQNGDSVAEKSFFYPAHLILILIPLAYLKFPTAHLIWLIIIQLLTYFSIWLVYHNFRTPKITIELLLIILLATFYIPNVQHIAYGQFNSINMIFLALSLIALKRGDYFLGGAFVAGLTFKPQATLFTLIVLLLWAILKPERWRLLYGFGLASLTLLGIAEMLQPGWIPEFIDLFFNEYTQLVKVDWVPVFDNIWNPMQITSISFTIICFAVFYKFRNSTPESPIFSGFIALSLLLNWIVIPFVSMYPLVAFPLAFILFLGFISNFYPKGYFPTIIVALVVYALGTYGFVYGTTLEPDGMHNILSERWFKIAAPLLISFSLLVMLFRLPNSSIQEDQSLSHNVTPAPPLA